MKEQFKETTERMIEQNNMEIIVKRLVDNIIKNAVEEVKNEKKQAKENFPCLVKQLMKMTILQKIKSLHKICFLSPSKIRRSKCIAKKNYNK